MGAGADPGRRRPPACFQGVRKQDVREDPDEDTAGGDGRRRDDAGAVAHGQGEAVAPVPLLIDEATTIFDGFNQNSLTIYPNPVSDVLRVSASEVISRVSVFNSVGNKVLESMPESKSVTIQVQQLAAGVYTVQIEIDNEVTNRKIVKTSK